MCKLQYGFGNHSRNNTEESFKLKHDLCLGSLVAQTVKNLPAMQETQVRSLGQEDPLEKGMAAHSIFLPGEPQGRGAEEPGVLQSLGQ